MKFNWGTGIFIFLAMFLVAGAAFIIFAMNQEVSLVHDDYYERGVDYTHQMEIDARSVKFQDIVQAQNSDESLIIGFSELPGVRIDSGNLRLYRPSDSKLDISFKINESELSWAIQLADLVSGRYILDLSWYSKGLQYEVKKPLTIDN